MKYALFTLILTLAGCASSPRIVPAEQDPQRPFSTTTCTSFERGGSMQYDCKTVPGIAVAKLPISDSRCDIEYKLQKFGMTSGPMYDELVPQICKELRNKINTVDDESN